MRRREVGERIADKSVRASNGCLEWTGCLTRPGSHGQVWTDSGMRLVHRVAWELVNGPVPDGLFVCHTCDNPICVDVSHLFLGTHRDNMTDRSNKGRSVTCGMRGESHLQAKVTEAQVVEIRQRYAQGNVSQKTLGKEYGLSQRQIGRIVKNESWGMR